MLTQIYEISSPDEARAISSIGVDHIGVLVGNGEFPREQPVASAATIGAAIQAPARFVALFLTADIALIEAWARELRPSIVHLGAAHDLLAPADVAALKSRLPDSCIMRSVPVSDEGSVRIAQDYDGVADFLLLDTYRAADRQIGAVGLTHDWTISRRIVQTVATPVILAGGLGPDNVAEASRIVRPTGVDSKTKTDRDGLHVKDIDRVRRFHQVAKAVTYTGSVSSA